MIKVNFSPKIVFSVEHSPFPFVYPADQLIFSPSYSPLMKPYVAYPRSTLLSFIASTLASLRPNPL